MSRNEVDIHDDELRVIGQKRTPHSSEDIRHKKLWWWIAAALLICGIIAAVFLFSGKKEYMSESEAVVFEPMIEPDDNPVAEEALAPLGDYSDTTLTKAYTEHLRDTINDIPLDIYIPHNAVP